MEALRRVLEDAARRDAAEFHSLREWQLIVNEHHYPGAGHQVHDALIEAARVLLRRPFILSVEVRFPRDPASSPSAARRAAFVYRVADVPPPLEPRPKCRVADADMRSRDGHAVDVPRSGSEFAETDSAVAGGNR